MGRKRIRILGLTLPIFMAGGACRQGSPARPMTPTPSSQPATPSPGEVHPAGIRNPTPTTLPASLPAPVADEPARLAAPASDQPAPPPDGPPLAVFGSYRMLPPEPVGGVDLLARQRIGGIPIVFESQRQSLFDADGSSADFPAGPGDFPQSDFQRPDAADPWRRFHERTLIAVRGRVVTEALPNRAFAMPSTTPVKPARSASGVESSTYFLAEDRVERCGMPSPFLGDLGEELIVLIDGACLSVDLPGVQFILQFQSESPDGGWLSGTSDLKPGEKNYVPIDLRGSDYHGGGRLLASNVASLITGASSQGGSKVTEGQRLLGEVLGGKAMPGIVVWIEYP